MYVLTDDPGGNRLIAAMSTAVVVVETAVTGGARMTVEPKAIRWAA